MTLLLFQLRITNFVRNNVNMDVSMYDTLRQLPLFRGIAELDFNNILQKVKLEFCRYEEGTQYISAGDKCDKFVFLLNGKVLSSRPSDQGLLTFEEVIDAPYLFEPYSMFGSTVTFTKSYTSLTPISILSINKQYLYSEFNKYDVCRMNLLNTLSGRAQFLDRFIWNKREMSLGDKLIQLFQELSEIPTGEKHLQIKMKDLADILDATRINVSKELNRLEDEKKIELRRKVITIFALENLTNSITPSE